MIQQPDFYSKEDECRNTLIRLINTLKDIDPEFVLKVSLILEDDENVERCNKLIKFSVKKCEYAIRNYGKS